MRATIHYSFDMNLFVAEFEHDNGTAGYGDTPQEAVEALRYQANKHELWPKEVQ